MKRWWLAIALLLSVGINIGVLATLALRGRVASAPAETLAPAAAPATGESARPAGERTEARARVRRYIVRMADDLGLAGERRERFYAIQRRFFRRLFTGRAEVMRLQQALRLELAAPVPDRTAAERLLEQQAAAHLELERALVDNLFETRALLGPDEEKLFLQFVGRMQRLRRETARRNATRNP